MRRCRENGRVPHSVRTALSGDGRPSSDEEASIVASVAAQDVEYTRPCQPFSGQRESAWTYVENATIYHAQYDLRCCPEKNNGFVYIQLLLLRRYEAHYMLRMQGSTAYATTTSMCAFQSGGHILT